VTEPGEITFLDLIKKGTAWATCVAVLKASRKRAEPRRNSGRFVEGRRGYRLIVAKERSRKRAKSGVSMRCAETVLAERSVRPGTHPDSISEVS